MLEGCCDRPCLLFVCSGGEADFHDADGGDITPGEPVVVTPGKEDEVKVKRFNVKVLEFVTEAQVPVTSDDIM